MGNVTFRGNYDGPLTLGTDRYFVDNDQMVRSDDLSTLRSFHAFFEVGESTEATNFHLTVDGITTGVHEITDNPMPSTKHVQEPLYNLSGQRVNEAAHGKGIFITSGAKRIIR